MKYQNSALLFVTNIAESFPCHGAIIFGMLSLSSRSSQHHIYGEHVVFYARAMITLIYRICGCAGSNTIQSGTILNWKSESIPTFHNLPTWNKLQIHFRWKNQLSDLRCNVTLVTVLQVTVLYNKNGIILPYFVKWPVRSFHSGDVMMGAIASQITSLAIVYSTIYSDADQR